MKSKFYLGLMALAALSMSSCSKDQVVSQAPEANNAIAFDSYLGHAAQTKGQDITADNIRAFKVFGYMYDANKGEFNWENNPKSDFMPATEVTSVDGAAWSYSPMRYWPVDQNGSAYTLNFYAYAPIDDAIKANDAEGVITGKPSVTYTLPATIADQLDLVWAAAEDQTKEVNAAAGVNMQFKHALSKVTVNAHTTMDQASVDIKIISMSIKAVQPSNVQVSLIDGALTPATDAAERTYAITLNTETTNKLKAAPLNVCEDGNLYLIPTEAPGVKIDIVYEITAGDYVETFTLTNKEVTALAKLEARKAYNININVNGSGQPGGEFEEIDFTVTVDPWEDGGSTDIEL